MPEYCSNCQQEIDHKGDCGCAWEIILQHKRYVRCDEHGEPIHSDSPDGPWEPIPPTTPTPGAPTRE